METKGMTLNKRLNHKRIHKSKPESKQITKKRVRLSESLPAIHKLWQKLRKLCFSILTLWSHFYKVHKYQ